MSRARVYPVKPAALRATRRYQIAGTSLSEVKEAGSPLWQADLKNVTHARWQSRRLGQSITRMLVLHLEEDRREIRQHLTRRAFLGGPDDMAFRAAIIATLEALMAAQPTREIEEGLSERLARLIHFSGLGLMVAGISLPILTLLQTQSPLDFATDAMPGLLAVFLGMALRKGYGPKRQRRMRPIAELIAELKAEA